MIGAVIGGAVAAAAGEVAHREHEDEAARDEELDEEIGVIGGDIGAAKPNQPPARGAFHAASLGISTAGHTAPAEGPIQDLDDE